MSILCAFGLWFVLGSISAVDPLFPPHAVLGGTVVAKLHFVLGKVESVEVLSGEEPFVDSCISALKEWQEDPAQSGDEVVITHFRQPYLYSFGDTREEITPAAPNQSLPYPMYIVQPTYPADALAQGSVVLRVDISAKGEVSGVQVVKPMGILTDTSIEAVRDWKFEPREMPSHAYAVLVYRFPLTTP